MTPERIIKIVSDRFKLSYDDLVGRSRHRNFMYPRIIAYSLIYTCLEELTLREIGESFNRDHSTIVHGLKNYINSIEKDYINFDQVVLPLMFKIDNEMN